MSHNIDESRREGLETAGVQPGSNPAPSTIIEPRTSGQIFKTIWELKKKGRAEATLRGISKKMKMLAREINLDEPDAVKVCIANKQTSNSYKEGLCARG